MENNEMLQKLLEQVEKDNKKKLLFAKLQLAATALLLVCVLVFVLILGNTAGLLQELGAEVQAVSQDIQDVAGQAVTVLSNLETVTSALAQVDLNSMVTNVDSLVTESHEAVEEALGKINSIDIDTLNKAIADLADVVEPLAKVSSIFG